MLARTLAPGEPASGEWLERVYDRRVFKLNLFVFSRFYMCVLQVDMSEAVLHKWFVTHAIENELDMNVMWFSALLPCVSIYHPRLLKDLWKGKHMLGACACCI